MIDMHQAVPFPPHSPIFFSPSSDDVREALFPARPESGLAPPDYIIAPAVSYHQHRACAALVRRMYAWRGYRLPPSRVRIDDPQHVVFGAWLEGELVATLTGSRDSSAGLAADALYGQELAHLRRPGRVVCEVTRLAVDADCHDPDLLDALFSSAYQYARAVFGGTDVIAEVNPRHSGYYRRQLGFDQIGSLRTCPRVDAPAVLLHRKLDVRYG